MKNGLIFKNEKEVIDFYLKCESIALTSKEELGEEEILHNKITEVTGEYGHPKTYLVGGKNGVNPAINHYFRSGNKLHTVSVTYDGNNFIMSCGSDEDTVCNFHKDKGENLYEVGGHQVCKHILAAAAVSDPRREIPVLLNDIVSMYEQAAGEKHTEKAEEFQTLKKYAFKIPVLVEGDRGSGKTYEAFAYAKSIGIDASFVGGHAGIESIDLLGCLVPYNNGGSQTSVKDTEVSAEAFFSGNYSMNTETSNSSNNGLVWKDGPIAEAFRKAQNGEKAVLIIDELLRIPQRELNILLTALSPVDGRYHLRTGRILEVVDGVAKEETLSCSTKDLFILATTNVGGQYAVDTIDPALAERFMVVRKDTEFDSLVSILKNKATEKGFNSNLADKAGMFFNRMLSAKEQGMVEEIPTLRTLSRAFELADTEDEVKDYIYEQHLLWVSRDVYGKPDKEQIDTINLMLKQIF